MGVDAGAFGAFSLPGLEAVVEGLTPVEWRVEGRYAVVAGLTADSRPVTNDRREEATRPKGGLGIFWRRPGPVFFECRF